MATIKSYTDIKQSRKLTEILPIESVDYTHLGKDEDNVLTRPYFESCSSELKEWINKDEMSPCWSLASLLGVLPSATLDSSSDHYYRLHCMERYTEWYDNPIDACYEMILKLHELNLL